MAQLADVDPWVSGHIFFEELDVEATDRFVVNIIAPCLREGVRTGLIRSYFFIRYRELGPHVRVRILPRAGSHDATQEWLSLHVEASTGEYSLGVPAGPIPSAARTSSCKSLLWLPYVPELERYGGDAAVQVAEMFFRESSDITFTVLRQIADGTADRLGVGLASMLVLLRLLVGVDTRAAALANEFARGICDMIGIDPVITARVVNDVHSTGPLVPAICDIWEGAGVGDLPEPLDKYADAVRVAESHLAPLFPVADANGVGGVGRVVQIGTSYMHMTNNRLGLSNLDEAHLAYLISIGLSHRGQMIPV
jgi:hypothetical protein